MVQTIQAGADPEHERRLDRAIGQGRKRKSNLGGSIGTRGVLAPGDNITSLGPDGEPVILRGTTVAAALVTGALALLWSQSPTAPAAELLLAVRGTANAEPRGNRTAAARPLAGS